MGKEAESHWRAEEVAEDWKVWSEMKQKMNEQIKLEQSTDSRSCYEKVIV